MRLRYIKFLSVVYCTVAIFSLIETCTEVVTSVFRQYETGLREGVIDVKVVLFFIFNYHNLRQLFLIENKK